MDIKLIISFDEWYFVTRVNSGGKERTYVKMDCPSDILDFGEATPENRQRAQDFAKALSEDEWVEYNGRRTRSERPESGDPFHQFLNHKLNLIYEDAGHLIYQAERKPRRKSPRSTQPEQPEV